jgi:hypothetical protein
MIPLAYLRHPQDGSRLRFANHIVSINDLQFSVWFSIYLFKCHSVLDQKCDSGIEVSDVFLQHKILLRLAGYFGLEVTESALRPC